MWKIVGDGELNIFKRDGLLIERSINCNLNFAGRIPSDPPNYHEIQVEISGVKVWNYRAKALIIID